MGKIKVGKRVVVTASDEELRNYCCNGKIKNGGSHEITGISKAGESYCLDGVDSAWLKLGMIKLANPKWSIYTNDIEWCKLSNKQKGKLLLASHEGLEFRVNGNSPINYPFFSDRFAVYLAVKGSK